MKLPEPSMKLYNRYNSETNQLEYFFKNANGDITPLTPTDTKTFREEYFKRLSSPVALTNTDCEGNGYIKDTCEINGYIKDTCEINGYVNDTIDTCRKYNNMSNEELIEELRNILNDKKENTQQKVEPLGINKLAPKYPKKYWFL